MKEFGIIESTFIERTEIKRKLREYFDAIKAIQKERIKLNMVCVPRMCLKNGRLITVLPDSVIEQDERLCELEETIRREIFKELLDD